MAVIYQTLFGTKGQTIEVAIIIEQFPKIKATVLEHKVIFPKTTIDDKRVMVYYELELRGPLKEINKYFKALGESPNLFYNDLTGLIS